MALRSRPCMLAVAFVAAAWVSVASSVPEQAGSSQKAVNCVPCSRTYVADAYLDALRGQLALHRDLTEVPDTAGLCKGLTDDLDMPTVSEVHRQLVGEGSHRRLVYSVKFGNCKDAMEKFLDGYDANLVIIEKLPSGVFADPFELQHFVERKVFLDVAVFGDTNLELPSALSNRSAVEIHFDLKPSKSMDCNLVVELPLHVRYPLAEHHDLTEVSDTADLCKGHTDDLDVPTVSEVHRQLVGEGSHRRLFYSVKFGNCKDAMEKFLDGYDADLVIIEKLPRGVFADPFELQHFVERKVFLDVAVFGDTNLELPSALSNQSAVEIHFDLKPSKSMDCNLVVELPLHARYPPLDTSGYATVEFQSPDLLVRYRKKETHPGSCIWVLQNLDAAPLEKAVWRVPCGDEVHAGFVSSLTFVSALVCSMSIVLAASLIS
ncbi:hypothetical protein ACQ4PT_048533 [Festuca glaucescens]